jgi:hypothetical protein
MFINKSLLYPSLYKLIEDDLPKIEKKKIEIDDFRKNLIERLQGRFFYLFNNPLFIA